MPYDRAGIIFLLGSCFIDRSVLFLSCTWTELDALVELPRASLTTSTVTRTNTEISSENFDFLHRTGPVEFGSYTTGLASLGRNGFLNEASSHPGRSSHLWLRAVVLPWAQMAQPKSPRGLVSNPLAMKLSFSSHILYHIFYFKFHSHYKKKDKECRPKTHTLTEISRHSKMDPLIRPEVWGSTLLR